MGAALFLWTYWSSGGKGRNLTEGRRNFDSSKYLQGLVILLWETQDSFWSLRRCWPICTPPDLDCCVVQTRGMAISEGHVLTSEALSQLHVGTAWPTFLMMPCASQPCWPSRAGPGGCPGFWGAIGQGPDAPVFLPRQRNQLCMRYFQKHLLEFYAGFMPFCMAVLWQYWYKTEEPGVCDMTGSCQVLQALTTAL